MGRFLTCNSAALLFLGLTSLPAVAQTSSGELNHLPLLRSYSNHRVSSTDRTGANDDGYWEDTIKPGETRTLAEIEGPSIITRIGSQVTRPRSASLDLGLLFRYVGHRRHVVVDLQRRRHPHLRQKFLD